MAGAQPTEKGYKVAKVEGHYYDNKFTPSWRTRETYCGKSGDDLYPYPVG